MANSSITATSVIGGGNPSANAAGNASNAAGNASNAAANASSNASTGGDAGTSGSGGGAPAWVADFCDRYGDFLLYTALAFLLFALALAVAHGIVALQREWKNSGGDRGKRVETSDLPKFMDSLKALVEALAKAPAWFAMFLGGALLLWLANDHAQLVCVPQSDSSEDASNNANSRSNNTSTATSRPKTS